MILKKSCGLNLFKKKSDKRGLIEQPEWRMRENNRDWTYGAPIVLFLTSV